MDLEKPHAFEIIYFYNIQYSTTFSYDEVPTVM